MKKKLAKKMAKHVTTLGELKNIIGEKEWILNDLVEHCEYCQRCKDDGVLTDKASKTWRVAGNRAKVLRVEIGNLRRQLPPVKVKEGVPADDSLAKASTSPEDDKL